MARPGQRIGLLGGSFDPPHEGHVHVSHIARLRFGLDAVWWLVSPGNPLKPKGPAPMATRVAAARALIGDPHVTVTDVEAKLGTRYTAETLDALTGLYPGVRFVWLMGADNLATFHQWQDWRGIAASVPIGVIARPGQSLRALHGPAARALRDARLEQGDCRLLGDAVAPAWCYVTARLNLLSSSELRRIGKWPRSPARPV